VGYAPPVHDPRAVLEARRAERREAVAALERRDARIAHARLAAFGLLTASVIAAFSGALAWAWAAVPGAAFLALVLLHDRALQRLARARRAVAFCEAGLSRLDERWAGTGDAGDRYAADDHPYARDLDLFGKGSLFELLCLARTGAGADLLASWLLAPAAAAEVRARQRAVEDLAPRLDLREDLAVLGEDVRAEVHAERLAVWAEAPRALPAALALPALALAAGAVAALVLWLAGALHGLAFAAALAGEYAVLRAVRNRVQAVLGGVERPGRELAVLANLVARLEREPFDDERLRALRAVLGGAVAPLSPALSPPGRGGTPPRVAAAVLPRTPSPRLRGEGRGEGRTARATASRSIHHLSALVERAGWAHNQIFAPVAFLLLWKLQAALAVERWRAAHGRAVRAWIAAAAELEALAALAGHAFLHPHDPFPDVEDAGALYEAEGLGHPLIPATRSVPNDVRLGPEARLLVVSGSNMSGKSTLLRTVGANAALALAGGPVRAQRLRLAPLRLGATLRIQDSLAEGRSRFWAEITRLRQVMDLAAGGTPVLFLLDELLAGTNSRDRRIGAEAVLRALLQRGAIGLVTTHDLALSEMAVGLGAAANAHFEDEVHGSEVVFDYRLRPGVVTRSNALALMRAVGLEV
jgi:MutS-like protein